MDRTEVHGKGMKTMNLHSKKVQKKISTVIIIILVVAMIVPILLGAVV